MFQPPPKNQNYRVRMIVVGAIVAAIVGPILFVVAISASMLRGFAPFGGPPSSDDFNRLSDNQKVFRAHLVCRAVDVPQHFQLIQESRITVTPTLATVNYYYWTVRPDSEISAFFLATLTRSRTKDAATGKFNDFQSSVTVAKTGDAGNASIYVITCDRFQSTIDFAVD